MPSYNGGFPTTYQPLGYPAYYTPAPQPPMIQQPVQPTQIPAATAATMTPPTIRAEIIQVDGEDAARTFPVGAGASQMLMAKDDSAIFIKTALPNGTTTLDVYVRRPPAPAAPAFDPEAYVRKDEIESLVAAAVAAQTGQKRSRKEPVEE